VADVGPLAAALEEIRERSGMAADPGVTNLVRTYRAAESAKDVPRLLAAVEAVAALCRDTDGNWLPPQSELPVGEFQAAITRGLLGEEAPGGA
jgi:hypothetical protein